MTNKVKTPISFLKPDFLLRAEQDYASRKITLEELRQIQDNAISSLIEKQLNSGLETITDGAFRQINGLRDFWMHFRGVTPTVVISGHLFQDQNAGEVIPKVTSKVSFNPANEIFNNFSFLLKEAGDGSLVRMDIPAPSLFYLDLIRNEWYDRFVYPDTAVIAHDIAVSYNATLRALYNSGCRQILLIDSSWGRLCDRNGAKRLIQGGIDLINLPQTLLEINEKALEGIPEDMNIILYTPIDTQLKVDCEEIVKKIFSHERVNAFMIDYPDNTDNFFEFLKLLPEHREIILGIEDSQHPQTQSVDDIRNMILKVSAVIPSVHISLTTKGGFTNNTDIINFSSLDEPDQWNKIENLLNCEY